VAKKKDKFTRTDGGRNMLGLVRDALKGSTPRPLRERKDDVDKILDEISEMKKRQDKLAGITRRS